MIDVNICLSPTVIRKYLWFNIHMDSYLPITFWYIIYIQKQYLCWIFVSLKMFTPNLQYSYQTGLEWLKEGVKSIFLNDSRSFWSIHVQEDNKPALEKHSLCRTSYMSQYAISVKTNRCLMRHVQVTSSVNLLKWFKVRDWHSAVREMGISESGQLQVLSYWQGRGK